MIKNSEPGQRALKNMHIQADLAVIGGGLAGTCCALTAAREGINVVFVQDRPVLGGNASSEVRLWALGATSHMGNNNRWAREGGVIDEIMLDNMYRNPEGNPVIFDTILLEKVWEEKNITLLLNTAVYATHKSSENTISKLEAFCSQNSTRYEIQAPLFCDASGDGIVGFQAGAAFRMGAETKEEFGEGFAPSSEYGELLGHSIYFMSKDVGKPVTFVPPTYALKDITKIPRYRNFSVKDQACWMWWIEYGGRLDTIHDSETIKWELWKVVYGVWDYIKNSGNFPEAKNLTLEWVGHIPGKRESRRFEGHYMLNQNDIVEQRAFYDSVSFGGWAIDLHPADGVFSEKPGCNQWHSKGIYPIPYRCMISRNIDNLFLAGRIISASHLAFGSTRVMMTCAHGGQAVGMAAALCVHHGTLPAHWAQFEHINTLQQALLKSGQYIPHVPLHMESDFSLNSSSELQLSEIPFNGDWLPLQFSSAQLLPLAGGPIPRFEVRVNASMPTVLEVSLRKSSKTDNYTPDEVMGTLSFDLQAGIQSLDLDFQTHLPDPTYVFLCFHENEAVSIKSSNTRITGLLSAFNKHNKAVSNFGKQSPDPSLGFESFEFWTPYRRPGGPNIALKIAPPLSCFSVKNIINGWQRPTSQAHAWVADLDATTASLQLDWPTPKLIKGIILSFDTDWDHPLESVIWSHPERVIPFVVRDYEIYDAEGTLLHQQNGNYQTRNTINFNQPITTRQINIQFSQPSAEVPIALFAIQVY